MNTEKQHTKTYRPFRRLHDGWNCRGKWQHRTILELSVKNKPKKGRLP
jgi:hypothetical protein